MSHGTVGQTRKLHYPTRHMLAEGLQTLFALLRKPGTLLQQPLGESVFYTIVPCLYRSDKKVTSFITKHMPAELVEGLQTLRRKESQATPLATPSAGPSPAHSGALPVLPSTTKISAAAPQAAQAAVDDHSVSKQELR